MGWSRTVVASAVFVLAGVVAWMGVSPALAVTPGPGWSISSLAQPSDFLVRNNTTCEENSLCDSYTITVTNAGAEATNGEPITITDALPLGLTVQSIQSPAEQLGRTSPGFGFETDSLNEFPCEQTPTTVTCTFEHVVPAGDQLWVRINVTVDSSTPSSVRNRATVEGGGAPAVSTEEPTTVANSINSVQPKFGIQDFGFDTYGVNGVTDKQAGGHPYELTTRFDLNSAIAPSGEPPATSYAPVEGPKNIIVTLPLGFVGDPLATAARCAEWELNQGEGLVSCPVDSRIGTITFNSEGSPETTSKATSPTGLSALYNMVPNKGYPAEFGFTEKGETVVMYASLAHVASGYVLRVGVPGTPQGDGKYGGFLAVDGVSLTLFGGPDEQNGVSNLAIPFFTNPVACASSLPSARIEADSWEDPSQWVSLESTGYPQVKGCGLLQFEPTIGLTPEVTQADEPSGYGVDLQIPQAPSVLSDPATPVLKNVTIALPEGISASPSAADGLVGCKATGPEGIDIPTGSAHPDEAGEGEEIGADGLNHLAQGHCPAASTLGTVEVITPLLPSPLTGHVYVAQPKCGGEGQPACTEAEAAAGNLFGLYIEAEGSGVIIKLAGSVSANPQTGRLTATFRENPQLPFSDLKLQFKGGPRAPLANPQSCGTFTTTSDLSSWASPEVPDANPSSSFEVGGCEGNLFAPAFSAGTVTPLGGGYSPFTLTFSRKDREQDLAGITVNTPPGLLGKIAGVERCPEPQAGQGTCGPGSLIGHTQVAAGAGSHPYWVSGNVYLTGPYKGAPFGLSVVVPTVAGPFKLAGSNGQGDDVVRAAIRVNPNTSALSVTSDPLPQIIDGVPLRIQTVNVTIDRPGFMFNPTNCAQQAITGTVTSAQGAVAGVSSPFAVAGCANLPFKPAFTVSTQAKTSKANGASLDVMVGSGAGQANIGKVHVTLPKQLPARLTTLQKACTDTQFYANPAGCPAASIVGTAVAHTPVLANPLSGPAYLVSHGGVAFPDLVIVLQGEGITLLLDGNTNIKKGITTSTFNSVPDAPVSSFELKLPEGSHSVLATDIPAKARGSMCGQSLTMPTTITGQNGAVVTQTTKIGVTGCPKAKKVKKKVRHGGKGGKGKKK